jgi:hypothetical protein
MTIVSVEMEPLREEVEVEASPHNYIADTDEAVAFPVTICPMARLT